MPYFGTKIVLSNKKTDLLDRFICVILGGPDGSVPVGYKPPLIIPPQTSVQEALLLLKIHLEGKSSVLSED